MIADIFVEDRAHEAFLRPLVERLAREEAKELQVRIRSARVGHGRALAELSLYQQTALKGGGDLTIPDLLVIGIDGNCDSFQAARKKVQAKLTRGLPRPRDRRLP